MQMYTHVFIFPLRNLTIAHVNFPLRNRCLEIQELEFERTVSKWRNTRWYWADTGSNSPYSSSSSTHQSPITVVFPDPAQPCCCYWCPGCVGLGDDGEEEPVHMHPAVQISSSYSTYTVVSNERWPCHRLYRQEWHQEIPQNKRWRKKIVFLQKYSQKISTLVQSNVNLEIKPPSIDTFVLLWPIVLYSFRIVSTSGFQNCIPNVLKLCVFTQYNTISIE